MDNIVMGTKEWKSFIKYRDAVESAVKVGTSPGILISLRSRDYFSLAGELEDLSNDLGVMGLMTKAFAETTEMIHKRSISTS